MKRFTLAAALLLTVRCVSTQDFEARAAREWPWLKQVRITENPLATAGCRYIGRVSAGSGRNSLYPEAAAEANMQEAAYKLGANVVFIGPNARTHDAASGTAGEVGEAYACPAAPVPPTPTPGEK